MSGFQNHDCDRGYWQCRLSWNPRQRIPNHRDSDYFDLYENPYLEPRSSHQKLLTGLYQCIYATSGPKILVPSIWKCSNAIVAPWAGAFCLRFKHAALSHLNTNRLFYDGFYPYFEIQNLSRRFKFIHFQDMIIKFFEWIGNTLQSLIQTTLFYDWKIMNIWKEAIANFLDLLMF